MKKLTFLLAIIIFFLSCELNPDTTVINSSSYPVSFQYSIANTEVETLPVGTSTSTKYFYTGVIILLPEKRITQNRDGGVITLFDLPSWDVHVENKTSNPVTLSADGWMDEMINIPTGDFVDDENHKGKVYTKNPAFSVKSDNFPLDVQWRFVSNIFYVVIRD